MKRLAPRSVAAAASQRLMSTETKVQASVEARSPRTIPSPGSSKPQGAGMGHEQQAPPNKPKSSSGLLWAVGALALPVAGVAAKVLTLPIKADLRFCCHSVLAVTNYQ